MDNKNNIKNVPHHHIDSATSIPFSQKSSDPNREESSILSSKEVKFSETKTNDSKDNDMRIVNNFRYTTTLISNQRRKSSSAHKNYLAKRDKENNKFKDKSAIDFNNFHDSIRNSSSLNPFVRMVYGSKLSGMPEGSINNFIAVPQQRIKSYALIDECYFSSVGTLLEKVNNWDFNIFFFDQICGDSVFENYLEANPYHNSLHAADVTQALHCLIQEEKWYEYLKPEDIFSVIIAAMCHDINHPGLNQHFLLETRDLLSLIQKEEPILENHHWSMTLSLLNQSKLLDHLSIDLRQNILSQIKSFILATNIKLHQDYIVKFRSKIDINEGDILCSHVISTPNNQNLINEPSKLDPKRLSLLLKADKSHFDLNRLPDRHFLLQIALKCSDVSNPARQWTISQRWSRMICQEFFNQGDIERLIKIPVTAFCDRTRTTIAQMQEGFLEYVVLPIYAEWHRFVNSPLSDIIMSNILSNQKRWDTIIKEIETTNFIPAIPEESEDIINDYSIKNEDQDVDNLPLSQSTARLMADYENIGVDLILWRRYSVPLSLPKPSEGMDSEPRRDSFPRFQKVKWHTIFEDETGLNRGILSGRRASLESRRRATMDAILLDKSALMSYDGSDAINTLCASNRRYSLLTNPLYFSSTMMAKINNLTRRESIPLHSQKLNVNQTEEEAMTRRKEFTSRKNNICVSLDDAISNPNDSSFSLLNRNLALIYISRKKSQS
ncbi:unnamed protein product [Gordionus sp. m RMFG-2023]